MEYYSALAEEAGLHSDKMDDPEVTMLHKLHRKQKYMEYMAFVRNASRMVKPVEAENRMFVAKDYSPDK